VSDTKLPTYGGQAVIEGVMMRGAAACAIAVRKPDDSIEVKIEGLGAIYRSRIAKIPFIRGLLILWDAIVLGMQALTFSANVQLEEEEQLEGAPMLITLGGFLVIGVGFFFLLPAGVAHLVENLLGVQSGWSNVVEGLVRLLLVIGYIWGIGFMADIRRVYGYHGAEHKTINAFEAGSELTVSAVQAFPREHPRCGTAFILTVVLFSVVLFSALGPLSLPMRLATRILFVPLLAALAYEYIRFTARISSTVFGRLLMAPNLWLQRLTTVEPDGAMIEVALAAFNAMRNEEAKPA
jgi:uncharacterized protein YqhQ